jgi:arsenate reductase
MNSDEESTGKLFPELTRTAGELIKEFGKISPERKNLLLELTRFIGEKSNAGEVVKLNFICTHNSRRSHMAQLWAQAAAHYYKIPGVMCYSGGTDATAFNLRAVQAMKHAGFQITQTSQGSNPVYAVKIAKEGPAFEVFSKRYNDQVNPAKDFAAIMTCSHADEKCPLVSGATKRIAITYEDPKDFDDTPLAETKYRERSLQIGREMFYVFANVKYKRLGTE